MTAILLPRALTRQVRSLSFVALFFLGAALPGTAVGKLEFSWEWDVYNLDLSRVGGGEQTFSSSSDVLIKAVSDGMTNDAAGQTNLSVLAFGVGNLDTRGFGALARVRANINPWMNPQLANPLITDVVAEVRFSDRVLAFTPILPIGVDMSFDFGPGLLTGTLETPSTLGVVGSAAVSLFFMAKPVIGNAPTIVRVFDESLTAGVHVGSPSIPSGLLKGLPLVNGVMYDWSLSLMVVASLIPGAFPNMNPPNSSSRSSFGETYYWGGLEGVFDTQGNPVANVTLTSDAGFDWVTVGVVPEPEVYAMLLAGLGLVGFVAGRKKQSHTTS